MQFETPKLQSTPALDVRRLFGLIILALSAVLVVVFLIRGAR
jgi:hypothetical protein